MKHDRWGLNKSQRMQLKAFVCLLGFLLLVVLLLGKLFFLLHRGGDDTPAPAPTPEPHIPVIQLFRNVWIMEVDAEGILIFRDGERERYPWGVLSAGEDGQEQTYQADYSVREQVADVTLTDGAVTSVTAKTEKINARILSADSTGIEAEGYGRLPLAADYKGYRLFDSLRMCTARDIYFGYDFTDLCMENGEVCGILMVKEEAMEYIRVLIKASDYSGTFHDAPTVTCNVDFTVLYGTYDSQKSESHPAGEELSFSYDSPYFEAERVRIIPDVLTGKVTLKNCGRSQGTPSYRGKMELLRMEDGIVVINEVLLEEYLYSVVPSEMPSGYPFEALKAQAVCARTYAYGHMIHAGYPRYGAHVDDSTSYQVYNNILEQESTTTAVKATYGQLLFTQDGNLAETYYYSTSCGAGTDAAIWKTDAAADLTYLKGKSLSRSAVGEAAAASTEAGAAAESYADFGDNLREEENFAAFISSVNGDDFESGESWYRWSYHTEALDKAYLLEKLQKRYAANSKLVLTWKDGEYVSETIDDLDDVINITIEKRGSGGVADELVIETAARKIKVISEHNIRSVLNDGKSKVVLQNGSRISSASLLPSAFLIITPERKNGIVTGYTLTGGGYGHGVGMSQNGARQMAKEGYSAEEILLYFYENCAVRVLYE